MQQSIIDPAAGTGGSLAGSRTIRGFADAHKLSTITVYRLIRRGELVAHKVGRRTIVTAKAEAAWLAALIPAKRGDV